MNLTSVTYTSLARTDLETSELDEIQKAALERNGDEGITSLLVYNGTHFLQVVEGGEVAVEKLLDRLRSDLRHKGFEIRERRKVDARSFPEWPMELLRVSPGYFQARDAIADRLPSTVPDAIRARLLRMTELISRIEFPS